MFCDYCSLETCVAELGDQASLYSPTSLAPIFDPVYSTRVRTVTVGIKTNSTTIQAIQELMYTIQTLSLQTRMGWVGVCASRFLGLTAAHSWEPVSLPPVNLRSTYPRTSMMSLSALVLGVLALWFLTICFTSPSFIR